MSSARNKKSKLARGIQQSGEIIILLSQTVVWCKAAFKNRGHIIQQMSEIGVDSVPVVSLMAIFIGMVIGLQTGHELARFHAEQFLGVGVAATLTRELAPVLTGLIIAGRAGASITAEIGTMKVSEEVDALRAMAIDPVRYLVMPRFLATIMVLPLLAMLTNVLGITGGYLIGQIQLGVTLSQYVDNMVDFVTIKDVMNGVVKAIVFGVIVSIISCYEGLNARGGARGVGRATTYSVVLSFLLIFVFDYFITHLLY